MSRMLSFCTSARYNRYEMVRGSVKTRVEQSGRASDMFTSTFCEVSKENKKEKVQEEIALALMRWKSLSQRSPSEKEALPLW